MFYPLLLIGEVKIVCVRRSKRFPDRPGTIARIEKITGLRAWLYSQTNGEQAPFFLIQIVVPNWEVLEPNQQIAVLDHEICHIDLTELGELTIRDHTIEEFPEIVGRHGSYHEGLQMFAEALERGNQSDREALIEQILNS